MTTLPVPLSVLLLVSALALAGCDRSPGGGSAAVESSTHRFEEQSSQQGPVRINRGGPKQIGTIALELDLTIGRETGPEEYLLAYPIEVEADGAGRITVRDGRLMSILVYAPDGRFVRRLGRTGDGPGEYRVPPELEVHLNGVVDGLGDLGQWIRWTDGGELLFDRRPFDSRAQAGMSRLTTPGGIVSYSYRDPFQPGQHDTSTAWWIVRSEEGLEPTSVAASFPKGRPTNARGRFEGNNLGTALPYAAPVQIVQSPLGGYLVCDPDSAAYRRYDREFRLEYVVRWAAKSEPLDRQECLAAMAWMDPEGGPYPEVEARQRRWKQTLEFPETKPIAASLLTALDGRVWIQKWGEGGWGNRYESRGEPDGLYEYWIFSPEGELEFEASLPFRVREASAEHVYEIFNDGESAPQIRRYRWRF